MKLPAAMLKPMEWQLDAMGMSIHDAPEIADIEIVHEPGESAIVYFHFVDETLNGGLPLYCSASISEISL
jgi:hypothetical protein